MLGNNSKIQNKEACIRVCKILSKSTTMLQKIHPVILSAEEASCTDYLLKTHNEPTMWQYKFE
jgi:hypothetical protein